MDISESTRIVFQRIQKFDPENVTKIIGHLLLDDGGEQEMLRLAFGSDTMVQSLIEKVKSDLGMPPKPLSNPCHVSAPPQEKKASSLKLPLHFTPFTPASYQTSSHPPAFRPDNGQMNSHVPSNQPLNYNMEYHPSACLNSATSQYGLSPQPQLLSLAGPHSVNNYCHELAKDPIMCHHGPFFQNLHHCFHDFRMNIICKQFSRGYCKYGASCRFLHVLHLENGHDMILNPPTPNSVMHNCHAFRHKSLKDLEMEIVELLKTEKGQPVLISSVPMLYHEKYGRMLEVEYYHMEHQWKGDVIHGLIQLSQISESICLVDRPNGEQSLMLLDDIPRYMRSFRGKREPEKSTDGSCQVYLNFGKAEDKMKHPMQNTYPIPKTESKPISVAIGPLDGVRVLKNQEVEREPPVELKKNPETDFSDGGTHPNFCSYTFEGTSSNGLKSENEGKVCNDAYDFEEVNLPDSPFGCEAGSSSSFFME